ncbi:pilus assembly protein TadG-related protein [Terasakiella pusilla]|uniref:pilus assembly protein TadG-related protein n=1 Tax=Terasakiella pusilla TaxID=64973 RepID=UPI003AA9C372
MPTRCLCIKQLICRSITGVLCCEKGAVSPFIVFVFIGAALATGFAVDTTRMVADKSQLKRATDAAAVAVAREYTLGKEDFAERSVEIARQYVLNNLGMDANLAGAGEGVEVMRGESAAGNITFSVAASFNSATSTSGFAEREIRVESVAEVRVANTEVALAIPNTLSESGAEMAVLRRLGKDFAEELIANSSNTWLSLVPYSQSVNVYDDRHANRVTAWSTNGALNPVELSSLFKTGYTGLADRRIPDRRAKLLCVYRGLNRGENYFWDQPPSGAFQIYYRHDLPENGSPGAPPISWVGPNPDFGEATGVNDTRWMVADKGCPNAALLPLTNDLDEINDRLDEMSARFNVNYAIAMGWAGMALAPEFRGSAGWDIDEDLPQDFDEGKGENQKAIILLVKSTDQLWFDSDAYNAHVGQKIDGGSETGTDVSALITERFRNLCTSFRARNLKFYLIVTGSDEGTEDIASASEFRKVAGAGLRACVDGDENLTYFGGATFQESEALFSNRLSEIVQDLRTAGGFVRLIK